MKLDCVLSAVNDNPVYVEFVPFFIDAWNKLYPKVHIIVILVMTEIPSILEKYKENLILFSPISSVNTSFISQYVRLLYPCILNYKNGIMITDIDMIPMNRVYYTQHIETIDSNKFIYFRGNECMNVKQLAMCYNVATAETWRNIFNIKSIHDIQTRLSTVYKTSNYVLYRTGWFTDQVDLYTYVMQWNTTTGNLVRLHDKDTAFNRLDRGRKFDIHSETIKENIQNGAYTDYHCLRPFNEYKNINYQIYELLQ